MATKKKSTRKISLDSGGPLTEFFSSDLNQEDREILEKVLGKYGIQAHVNAVGMLVVKVPSDDSAKIYNAFFKLNQKDSKVSIQEIEKAISSAPEVEQDTENVNWTNFSIRHHDSRGFSVVKPKTDNQALFMQEIADKKIIFGNGSAGAGKTFLAVAVASKYLELGLVEKIIICRPAVTSEEFGFLPGDIDEKMGPFLFPIMDILSQLLGNQRRDNYLQKKTIEILPVAFGRGLTIGSSFKPTIGIIDESQNLTYKQLKMMITRIGDHPNSKLIFSGDESQSDLKKGQGSALRTVSKLLQPSKFVGQVTFTSDDVVRSEAVKEALKLFEEYESKNDLKG